MYMLEAPFESVESVETRAGYVALVGRPNVGKSSLLNALVGERLSIVTPRAQTTRDRVLGIYTDEEGQIIFVDTPGILSPRYLLQHGMLSAASSAIQESDAILLLLDPTSADPVPGPEVLELLSGRLEDLFIALNKVDLASESQIEALISWSSRELGRDPFLISALEGTGVDLLRDRLLAAMPPSPYLYPPEDLAVQPVRFFVAELIRETIFEECHQEIPYSTAVVIEEFRESTDPILIRAVIYVERESQKGIVVGRGGTLIRKIGVRSREKIEEFVDARIYLDLWVKVLPKWRKRRGALRRLGYPLPPEKE